MTGHPHLRFEFTDGIIRKLDGTKEDKNFAFYTGSSKWSDETNQCAIGTIIVHTQHDLFSDAGFLRKSAYPTQTFSGFCGPSLGRDRDSRRRQEGSDRRTDGTRVCQFRLCEFTDRRRVR